MFPGSRVLFPSASTVSYIALTDLTVCLPDVSVSQGAVLMCNVPVMTTWIGDHFLFPIVAFLSRRDGGLELGIVQDFILATIHFKPFYMVLMITGG